MDFQSIEKFVKGTIWPESYADWWAHAAIFTALFVLFLLPFVFTSKLRFRKFLVTFAVWVVLWFPIMFCVTTIIIPKSQSYTDNETGVIIAKFSGASLEEFTGYDGIEERLKHDLLNQLRNLDLEHLATVSTVPWKVNSIKEAQRIKRLYNARGLIWGTSTKFETSANIELTIEWDSVGLGFRYFQTGTSADQTYDIQMTTLGPLEINFEKSTFTMSNLVSSVMTNMLPFLLGDSDPRANFLNKKVIGKLSIHNPLTASILFTYAQNLERELDHGSAIYYYDKIFELCCHMLLDTLINMNPYEKGMVQDFAANAKFQEGLQSIKIADTVAAVVALTTAARLSGRLEKSCAAKIIKLRIGKSGDWGIPKIPDCFSQIDGKHLKNVDSQGK